MGLTDRSVAVAVYSDRSQAECAVEELIHQGFSEEQVGFALLSRDPDAQDFGRARSKAEIGLAVGGLAGAALAGVVLPVAGIVVAGGVLTTMVAGAASGGILGTLIGLSVPEEDARLYERDFHAGHTIVTVHADGRYDEAVAILERARQSEVTPAHRGRHRLEGLAASPSASTGSGHVFVPEP
jgi:hypothetical protein